MLTDTAVWSACAPDLVDFTLTRLANRCDTFGGYKKAGALTVKTPLTPDILTGHFQGRWCVGLHALSQRNDCKWLAFDVDNHSGGDPATTERTAIELHTLLSECELEPLLFATDGLGSFHVIVVFDKPVPGTDVVDFGRWVTSQCSANGVEVFPKQADADYGSWLRLCGRHPKHRDHWHCAWAGGWLDAEKTVNLILTIEGADPEPVLDKNRQLHTETKLATTPVQNAIAVPAAEWTQRIIDEGAEVGDRNRKLFLAACDLKGRGHSQEQIIEQLTPGMLQSGLTAIEIHRTIKSAVSQDREPATDSGDELLALSADRFGSKPSETTASEPVQVVTIELAKTAPTKPEPAFVIKPISEVGGEGAQINWLWHPYLAGGFVTLLSGLWKCGKSTLLAHVLKLFGTGGKLVGSVQPGKVLVVAEEGEALWARRRDELGLIDCIHLICTPFITRPSLPDWVKFIEFLASTVQANGYSAVVFDTISRVWPVADENDAAKMLTALSPLQALTATGCGVLLLHHPRKSGGTEGQASRGSGALPGFVDTILELRRFAPKDVEDCRRVLTCYSRFDEPEAEVVLELTDDGYRFVGNKSEAKQADRIVLLLDLLPDKSPGLTVDAIREAWPDGDTVPQPGRRMIARDLQRALEDERVHRDGAGKRSDPHRFWR